MCRPIGSEIRKGFSGKYEERLIVIIRLIIYNFVNYFSVRTFFDEGWGKGIQKYLAG